MSEIRPALSADGLTLNPGDWVVVSTGDRVTSEMLHEIKRTAMESFVGHNVVVVANGLTVAGVAGFTWEDVDLLREAAISLYSWGQAEDFENTPLTDLADRIESLLPPREEE
jgi:hypothetical protein